MRIVGELKDYKGAVISRADVSELADFTVDAGSAKFRFLQQEQKLLRKGLFAASDEGDYKLIAKFNFNDKQEIVTKAVRITSAVALAAFDGPFVSGYPSRLPDSIYCFSPVVSVDAAHPDGDGVFFLGDEVTPFSVRLMDSSCSSLDKTADPGLSLSPNDAISKISSDGVVKWFASKEKKTADNKHTDHLISGSLAIGANQTLTLLNQLKLNIRERIIGIALSDQYSDRPVSTCAVSQAFPRPSTESSEMLPIYVWKLIGRENCIVTDYTFGGVNPTPGPGPNPTPGPGPNPTPGPGPNPTPGPGPNPTPGPGPNPTPGPGPNIEPVTLTLSVPEGANYSAKSIVVDTGSAPNILRLNSKRGPEPRALIVTVTFDFTNECHSSDAACLAESKGTVSKTLMVPGVSCENDLSSSAFRVTGKFMVGSPADPLNGVPASGALRPYAGKTIEIGIGWSKLNLTSTSSLPRDEHRFDYALVDQKICVHSSDADVGALEQSITSAPAKLTYQSGSGNGVFVLGLGSSQTEFLWVEISLKFDNAKLTQNNSLSFDKVIFNSGAIRRVKGATMTDFAEMKGTGN